MSVGDPARGICARSRGGEGGAADGRACKVGEARGGAGGGGGRAGFGADGAVEVCRGLKGARGGAAAGGGA